MKKDPVDGLPVVGFAGSSQLGARPGTDFSIGEDGNVRLDGTGMSVVPHWLDLHFTRIPKRLKPIFPGATGRNTTSCYTMGEGPFQRASSGVGLELIPDEDKTPVEHGVIAPSEVMSSDQYQKALQNTRPLWRIDETLP